MLRRISSILLSMALLVALSGVVITQHYCMGHLHSVKIMNEHSDACGDCGMDMDDDCCNDDSKYYSFDEDFSYSIDYHNFENIEGFVTELPMLEIVVISNYHKFDHLKKRPPPERTSIPVYKKVSSYLI